MDSNAKRYQSIATHQIINSNTNDPAQISLLLTDGALRFIREAGILLKQNKIADKCEKLTRVLDIFAALRLFIKSPEEEPAIQEISSNLLNLLDYAELSVINANIENNEKKYDEACQVLLGLRECFVACAEQQTKVLSATAINDPVIK